MEQIRDDVNKALDLDKRVRNVEISQARTETLVTTLTTDVTRMHADLGGELKAARAEIKAAGVKPPFPWAAISAVAAVFLTLQTTAVLIFTR